jgi:spore coat polysaccharide biosynthesis protein SpsF
MDVEVLTSSALLEAAAEASDPYDREHVTPFVSSRAHRYPQLSVRLEPPYGDLRVTLDTSEDLERIRAIVAVAGADASLTDIVRALGASPDPA